MRNRLGHKVTATLLETSDQILEVSSALHDLRVTIEGLSDEDLLALRTWCSGLDAEFVLKMARIFGGYHNSSRVLVNTPSPRYVRRTGGNFYGPDGELPPLPSVRFYGADEEVPGEEAPLAGPPYTPGRFENPGLKDRTAQEILDARGYCDAATYCVQKAYMRLSRRLVGEPSAKRIVDTAVPLMQSDLKRYFPELGNVGVATCRLVAEHIVASGEY